MAECIPGTTIDQPKVQLSGQNGNAFLILGLCQSALRKAGAPKEVRDAFFAEATSGDYDNLLATATKFCDVS